MGGEQSLELNRAVPGGRVEVFAIPDENYPGGWFYRFQYYHPEKGEMLRYDNAHGKLPTTKVVGFHHGLPL